MGTGRVSVSLSPLFEKSPPPEGRKSGRLKVPTGQRGPLYARHG